MKTAPYKTLGLPIQLQVPSTVEEFDQNAKSVGACLAEATKNVVYRGSLASVRDLIIHGQDEVKDGDKVVTAKFVGLEDKFTLPRKVKTVTTGEGDKKKEVETYDETEEEFVERLCAEKKITRESLQSHFDAAAALVPFDASARERKPVGPKTLPAKYKSLATEFITKAINPATKKPRSVEAFNAAAQKQLGKTFVASGDNEKDITALGWILKEFADAQDVFSKIG